MMKSLYPIILLLSTIGMANAADTPKAMASPYYKYALLWVPEGAEITDIIPTRKPATGLEVDRFYIKFDFEGTCYLAVYGNRRIALTEQACG